METTINQRIANLRKAKRLTQKQFAEKLNVSDKLVSKWEQDGNNPALEDIINISKIFNLTLDYLIYGKESADDTAALKPVPPPPPPFVDPIRKLVNSINTIITENHLQKYKEQLFPSSAVDELYNLVEKLRKGTLEAWHNGGYDSYYTDKYNEEYHEDRRSSDKPIDEKYWGQVRTSVHFGEDWAELPVYKATIEDMPLLEYGIFILKINDDFNYISFVINLNALLELDNFEIYSKIIALNFTIYWKYSECPEIIPATDYFIGLDSKYSTVYDGRYHTVDDFEELHKKVAKYGKLFDDFDIYRRPLELVPLTYKELLGLTDLRFLSLLDHKTLDMLLEHINMKSERAWEVIIALIDYGATKQVEVSDEDGSCGKDPDILGTTMLYELAKMKINK